MGKKQMIEGGCESSSYKASLFAKFIITGLIIIICYHPSNIECLENKVRYKCPHNINYIIVDREKHASKQQQAPTHMFTPHGDDRQYSEERCGLRLTKGGRRRPTTLPVHQGRFSFR